LDKVLYPSFGFTKRDVLAYYSQIAPVILPYLKDRAATFLRYPNGVESKPFYEKDVSRHQNHRGAILVTWPGAAHGVDAGPLGRGPGLPQARRISSSPAATC
jgi:hypothetical protein